MVEIKNLGFVILFGLVLIGGFFLDGYYHEAVHKEIYRAYGIDSKINLFAFPNMETVVTNMSQYYLCDSNCKLAHSNNEAVGYNLVGLYVIVGVGILCLIAKE